MTTSGLNRLPWGNLQFMPSACYAYIVGRNTLSRTKSGGCYKIFFNGASRKAMVSIHRSSSPFRAMRNSAKVRCSM